MVNKTEKKQSSESSGVSTLGGFIGFLLIAGFIGLGYAIFYGLIAAVILFVLNYWAWILGGIFLLFVALFLIMFFSDDPLLEEGPPGDSAKT